MCYSSFRGVRTRDRRWKGVGKRRGSGRWSFKLRRRNRWNEIEMHSPRSRPLRRPPGLFPVYSSRSLLKEEGRWARKERRDVEEKEKENLHQQTADCQLPYKYININSVYIYIYRIVVAFYQDLPKISIGYCYLALISSSKRFFLRSWNRGRRTGQPIWFSFHAIFFSLIFRCAGTGAEPETAVENTRGKRSDAVEILSSSDCNYVRSLARI